jgi:hypothetical protein
MYATQTVYHGDSGHHYTRVFDFSNFSADDKKLAEKLIAEYNRYQPVVGGDSKIMITKNPPNEERGFRDSGNRDVLEPFETLRKLSNEIRDCYNRHYRGTTPLSPEYT